MADAFTFAVPQPQKPTPGMQMPSGSIDVGAQYLSQGMGKFAEALAQAMMFQRQMSLYNAGSQGLADVLLNDQSGGGAGSHATGSGPTSSSSSEASVAPAGDDASPHGVGEPAKVVDAYTRQSAAKYNIDPNVASKILGVESGYGQNIVGDDGSSFGPFQLHYGGITKSAPHAGLGDAFTQATGKDARDPSTWREQVDFALAHAAQHGWSDWATTVHKLGIGYHTGIGGQPQPGVDYADAPAPGAHPAGGEGPGPFPPVPAAPGQGGIGSDAVAGGTAGDQMGPPAGPGQPANPPTPPERPADLSATPMQEGRAAAPQPYSNPPPGVVPPQAGGNVLDNPAASPYALINQQNGGPGRAAVAQAMAGPLQGLLPQFLAGGGGGPAGGGGASPAGNIPAGMQAQAQGGGGGGGMDAHEHALRVWALQHMSPLDPLHDMATKIIESRVNPTHELHEITDPASGAKVTVQYDPRTGQMSPVSVPGGGGASADQPPPGVNIPAEQWRQMPTNQRQKIIEETAGRQAVQGTPGLKEHTDFQEYVAKDPHFHEYNESLSTYNALMQDFSKQDTMPSDAAFIDSVAKILNPGGMVRQGAYKIMMGEQGLSDQVRGEINAALSSGSALTPETRAAMLQVAYNKVAQYKSAWDQVAPHYAAQAQHFGLAPEYAIPRTPDMAPLDLTGISSQRPSPQPGGPGPAPAPQGPQPPPDLQQKYNFHQDSNGRWIAPDPNRPGKVIQWTP